MSSSVFWGCDRSFCRVFTGCAALAALLLLVVSGPRLAAAEPPHIEYIEKLSTNQVTIHFYTEANRTYTLQVLDSLSCPTNGSVACSSSKVPTGSWSNLWTAPRLPFPNHYIITDYRTNRMRFYRLRVTP